jgi:hypothetical protein
MMREWSGIQGGNEIFNAPSNMLEYNMKVRKRARVRPPKFTAVNILAGRPTEVWPKGVLLTSHEVGTVGNRTEMRAFCP